MADLVQVSSLLSQLGLLSSAGMNISRLIAYIVREVWEKAYRGDWDDGISACCTVLSWTAPHCSWQSDSDATFETVKRPVGCTIQHFVQSVWECLQLVSHRSKFIE